MQKTFAAIFDLSFKKFVTPQLATTIFIVSVVLAGLGAVSMLHMPFGFIIAPVFFFSALLFTRAAIELVLAVFQIARYSAEIARRGRGPQASEEELDEAKVS